MFALPLNILITLCHVSYPKNPCTTLHTRINKPTKPHRLLCECQLYAQQNYDNDPEMKKVMENFGRKTSQRFEEYNERMIKNRQICKDQCDKDVQKIILKDKIEKELTEKLSTLQTDISTDEIPTCVCEKSLADKVEKTCLRCTQNLGGIVAPSSGVLGGIAELGLSVWKPEALITAKKLAAEAGATEGASKGAAAGVEVVISELNTELGVSNLGGELLKTFINPKNYNNIEYIYQALYTKHKGLSCIQYGSVSAPITDPDKTFCTSVFEKYYYISNGSGDVSIPDVIRTTVKEIVGRSEITAEGTKEMVTEEVTLEAIKTNTAAVEATYAGSQIAIIASIVAILIIVLVMVIIYLILRYKRKRKMKKKLQYIKLLKE
ncbi:PIR protein, putative [Plasmodium sp. gorilla clade G1]|nr:PIR protein, putative [Plasmodium sp. gorilla clade G1]